MNMTPDPNPKDESVISLRNMYSSGFRNTNDKAEKKNCINCTIKDYGKLYRVKKILIIIFSKEISKKIFKFLSCRFSLLYLFIMRKLCSLWVFTRTIISIIFREFGLYDGRTSKYEHIDNIHVSTEVYHRLLQRHAILHDLEKVENDYEYAKAKREDGSRSISQIIVEIEEKLAKKDKLSDETTRYYKLAVADLFVEKALAYLERDAELYRIKGQLIMNFARTAAISGFGLAFYIFFDFENMLPPHDIYSYLTSFAKSFTLFGMDVLIIVISFRYGKALLDQAERLFDRRHALRQGRLFIHLNGDQMNIEELDKAFQWNSMKENAFSGINSEASAPLGKLFNDIAGTVSSLADAATKIKSAADGKNASDQKDK